MTRRFRWLALAALLLAGAPARAAEQDAALRPEVGIPLQAAEALIRQHKYPEALAQVSRAEAAGALTARETGLINQVRGVAAAGAGDTDTAARSFEAAIAAGRLAPAEQLRLTQTLAGLHYQARNYPKVIAWTRRYQEAGGRDEQTLALLPQAYYLTEDWANAARTLAEQIAAIEHAGRTPTETQLQLLANIYDRQHDRAGYAATLEKLAASSPRRDYWADLIQRLSTRPGFPHRLALDIYRLGQAVGTLTTAAQYIDAAELALQAGLPGEAKTYLDQGFTAGVLGQGAEAARQTRLRALAEQKSADDLKALADSEKAAAAAPDGIALVNTGLDYLGHGQPQKAVQLIEQGIARGIARNPDDARLHLGIALAAAGAKDRSLQTFRTLQGGDAAELARLWAIHVGQH